MAGQTHPRDAVLDAAAGELLAFHGDFKNRHGLSHAEYAWMLLKLLEMPVRLLGLDERHAADKEGSDGRREAAGA